MSIENREIIEGERDKPVQKVFANESDRLNYSSWEDTAEFSNVDDFVKQTDDNTIYQIISIISGIATYKEITKPLGNKFVIENADTPNVIKEKRQLIISAEIEIEDELEIIGDLVLI